MLGIGLSVPQISGSSTAFTPLKLFAAGEQGVWYDPSDFATMFQDNLGTTPVTAVEQTVGLILDKSGRGNNASQATLASRPTLSARVNQLIYSEQFDNAAWVKANVSISANSSAAPDGTITADSCTAASTTPSIFQTVTAPATSVIFSVYAKIGAGVTKPTLEFMVRNHTTSVNFDIGTFNTVTGAITGTGWTSTAVDNVWYRVSYTRSTGITAGNSLRVYTGWTGGVTTAGQTWIIWGADLRATNDGVGLPVYQRIAAATDYDTTNFPLYLRFDGTDDSLATGSIDFSATNKATVWTGVRKLSDAAFQLLCELTAGSFAPGSFSLDVGTAAGDASRRTYGIEQYTSAGSPPTTTAGAFLFPSPDTRVMTGQWDKAQATQIAQMIMRLNGVGQTLTFNNANLGSGNFANDVFYIGRRGGTTAPLNARLYSLIVRGAQSTAAQVALTEAWINQRTKAY